METLVEQRREVRTTLAWPVSIWLPEANRFFNGRIANISKTGVFVLLPMTTPVSPGQKQKGQCARIKTGRVIRIERNRILEEANIGVAIQFE